MAIHGILGPGYVTTIIGARAWQFLPDEYRVPMAIAGFEALDMLSGVADLVDMSEKSRACAGWSARAPEWPGRARHKVTARPF